MDRPATTEDRGSATAGSAPAAPPPNPGAPAARTGPIATTLSVPPAPGAFWPTALRAMRHRDYRVVWSGALVSNVGTWMQNVARDWLIFALTGAQGAFWLGVNAFAEGLTLVLLLPLGGVLADRLDRRWVLVCTNALNAVFAAILMGLTLAHRLQAWHIIAITALTGATDAIRIPANQSMLPVLVGRPDVPNAVALNSMQFNISRVLGPMLGGVTLAYLGAAWTFGLNAASFLAVIGALLAIRPLPIPDSAGETLAQSLRGGVAYVRSRADLRMMLLLVVLGGMLTAPVTKLLPALAAMYGQSEGGFSKLLSCFGVGAVLGAVVLAVRSRRGPRPWRALPVLFLLGLCQALVGFRSTFPAALLLAALAGMLFIGTNVRLNTAIIASTPDHLRGRAMSFQVLAFRLGIPLGGLAAGWLAQVCGLRWAFWVFGLTLAAAAPLLLLYIRWRHVVFQSEADLPSAPAEAW